MDKANLVFPSGYERMASAEWRRFQQTGKSGNVIREDIASSWERLSRLGSEAPELEFYPQWKQALEGARNLVRVADNFFQRSGDMLAFFQSPICLVSSNGVNLHFWNTERGHRLWPPGALAIERTLGTTGSTLSLHTGLDEIVYGAEHYYSAYHGLVSIAAPIRLGTHGKTLALLAIWPSLNDYHPMHFLALKQAANAISLLLPDVFEKLERERASLMERPLTDRQNGMIGRSGSFLKVTELARKYALADLPVLIMGESGTGKELFAKMIHRQSTRAEKPLVSINCAALPREMALAELFGYSDGAFTGAKRGGKPGKIGIANGGTVFLDEVGELQPEMQAALLRFLENGEISRVGSDRIEKVNVRILAATNRDLADEVAAGRFRQDLYYRLARLELRLPPLRQRRDDIPLLIEFFVRDLLVRYPELSAPRFTTRALAAFQAHPWPGNCRQLRNVVEKILFTTSQEALTGEKAEAFLAESASGSSKYDDLPVVTAGNGEKQRVIEALKRFNGNVGSVAEFFGVSRSTMYAKLAQLGIAAKKYKLLGHNRSVIDG